MNRSNKILNDYANKFEREEKKSTEQHVIEILALIGLFLIVLVAVT